MNSLLKENVILDLDAANLGESDPQQIDESFDNDETAILSDEFSFYDNESTSKPNAIRPSISAGNDHPSIA
jgi:hypothetical protein